MGGPVWKRMNVVGPRAVNGLNVAGYGRSGPEKSWTVPSLIYRHFLLLNSRTLGVSGWNEQPAQTPWRGVPRIAEPSSCIGCIDWPALLQLSTYSVSFQKLTNRLSVVQMLC